MLVKVSQQIAECLERAAEAAFSIAVASVATATLLRIIGGWASSDLRFAIYLPAILATGLLAGVPVALGVGLASIFIIAWAFMPAYFEFKWLSENELINVFFNAVPYLITVFFAYLCRVVLQRLRRGERNNQILFKNCSTVDEIFFPSSTSLFKRPWPMIPTAPERPPSFDSAGQ